MQSLLVKSIARSSSFVSKALKPNSMNCAAKTFSTVADQTINLQFVDADGNRARLPGRVGQTLSEVALMHNIELEAPCDGGAAPTEERRTEDWVETTFGEGLSCFLCHVQIPSQYHHLLPETTEEMREGINETWEDEVNANSRLACTITLTKSMDGMIVYVPDVPPNDII
jgi:ferredoxin